MRICLIGKYPPIEGGVSSQAYWLTKALGERGHEIHVVTNAWEVEVKYREQIKEPDLNEHYQPKNVYVHNTDPFIDPAYIPYSKPYTEKIASLSIDVIREFDLQIIDSWYILPYVVSGFLAKSVTDKPQIMRHAGSDMSRLLDSPFLGTLFGSLFKKVDKIVTFPSMTNIFSTFGVPGERLFYNYNISVNTEVFNPVAEPIDLSNYTEEEMEEINNVPVITYIGKLGRAKGVYELVEAASRIKKDFLLLFVTQNSGLENFQGFIQNRGLKEKSLFLGFVPPWRVASVIKRSTCVVIPEHNFPVARHVPILPREVLATGKCLILSQELYDKMKWLSLKDQENLLVIDPQKISQFSTVLEIILKNSERREIIEKRAYELSKKAERFETYVDDTLRLYEEVLDGCRE